MLTQKMMVMAMKNNQTDDNEAVKYSQELEFALLMSVTANINKVLHNNTLRSRSEAIHNIRKDMSKAVKDASKKLKQGTRACLYQSGNSEYDFLKKKATVLVSPKDTSDKWAKHTNNYFKKYIKTNGINFVVGNGLSVPQYFTVFIEQNVKDVTDGVITVDEATKKAIHELSKTGLKVIDYSSGTKRNIDVFVREQLLYASKQSALELRKEFAEKNGITIWEFDAHPNARPTHQAWQGKRYDTTGKYYPKKEDLTHGEDEDYGCKHIAFPVWDRHQPYATTKEQLKNINTEPFQWKGKTYDGYSATQKQRQLEREIRAYKREKQILEKNGFDTSDIKHKLKNKNADYTSFCNAFGTYRRSDRTRVIT